MSAPNRLGPVITITGTSLLVGCGGSGPYCGSYGSAYSYGSCGYGYAVAPGYYTGSIRSTTYPQGTPVVALIAENGQGRIGSADGSYYRITLHPSGNTLNGSFAGYSSSTPLANGAQSANGSVSGTVNRTALQATFTDPTQAQQQLTLTANSADAMGSSLATLAGNWRYSANGFTLRTTIQLNGSFVATDSNSCTYNGNFSLIDPSHNEYAETHVRSCGSVNTRFTGLAAFIPGTGSGATGTSTQLKLLSDDGAGDYLVAELE